MIQPISRNTSDIDRLSTGRTPAEQNQAGLEHSRAAAQLEPDAVHLKDERLGSSPAAATVLSGAHDDLKHLAMPVQATHEHQAALLHKSDVRARERASVPAVGYVMPSQSARTRQIDSGDAAGTRLGFHETRQLQNEIALAKGDR